MKKKEKTNLKGFPNILAIAKAKGEDIEEIKHKIASAKAEFERTKGDFIRINVQWSRQWNAKATTNFGASARATGYGYDKLSSVVSEVLNAHKGILYLLYRAKERELRKLKKSGEFTDPKNPPHNHKLLGYGSGYWTLPYFEQGVGIDPIKALLVDMCKIKEFQHVGHCKTEDFITFAMPTK